MADETKKQLDRILQKQKKLLRNTKSQDEQAIVCGTWSGFLAGMKLTGAIAQDEYNRYYNELLSTVQRLKQLA